MLSCLGHRGPDAGGEWWKTGVALGHRRLKIIDLSDAANQPFSDGTDALVFNGEIFNFLELRKQLEEQYEFVTNSDTEVLFRGLQYYGKDCIDRLRGQFAFAFHSGRDGSLLLARDHVGICPLYIREDDRFFYFSSEIKPLLTIQPARLNPAGVADYFRFRYNIQNGRTLFEGIRRFPPAHFLHINLNTGKRIEKRYWRLSFAERTRSGNEVQREFNSLLDREITAQKVADVPVGMYLSGGIDSGALLSGFAKTSSEIQAFTMTFSKADEDGERVAELASRYRFDRNLIEFTSQSLEVLEDAVSSLEEPFGDLIICANYLLARQAAQKVRVVLSGEGGDEAFCGYDHQRAYMKMRRLQRHPVLAAVAGAALSAAPSCLLAKATSYPGGFGKEEKDKIGRIFRKLSNPGDAYLEMVSLFTNDELQELFTREFFGQIPCEAEQPNPIRDIFAGGEHPWQAVMRAEIEQLALIVNLVKQDRFGMRFSLEGRVPLVSRSVLEFAASLPFERLFAKVNKQQLLGYSGYRLIKKKPFSLMANRWYIDAVMSLMDKYAGREPIEENGILSWQAVQRLREQLSGGGMLAVKKAMAVIVFQVFQNAFKSYLLQGNKYAK
jgi:asparagine synthase (glutamine-hydrolysing)